MKVGFKGVHIARTCFPDGSTFAVVVVERWKLNEEVLDSSPFLGCILIKNAR